MRRKAPTPLSPADVASIIPSSPQQRNAGWHLAAMVTSNSNLNKPLSSAKDEFLLPRVFREDDAFADADSMDHALIPVAAEEDPMQLQDRHATAKAMESYLLMDRYEEAKARSTRKGETYHLTHEDYGLSCAERQWLSDLYHRYRHDPLNVDNLKELLWSVDRESMDTDQVLAKLQGAFGPASTTTMLGGRSPPSSSNSLPVQSAPPPLSNTAMGGSSEDISQPLTFEQLLDYAAMVKSKCSAQISVQDQATIDAFVLLGGDEDQGGEVQIDTLRRTIEEFRLNIDVDAFVAAVDRDGDGTISFAEFSRLYNDGISEVTSPCAAQAPQLLKSESETGYLGITSALRAPNQLHSVVEALQNLHRGTVLPAATSTVGLNVSQTDYSVSRKKGNVGVKHKPPPVSCSQLHSPHELAERFGDVLSTHDARRAYVGSVHKKMQQDAVAQDNRLLANALRCVAAAPLPGESSSTPPEVSPAFHRGARYSEDIAFSVHAKSDANRNRQPNRLPRIPTVAELVEQRMRTTPREKAPTSKSTETKERARTLRAKRHQAEVAIVNQQQVVEVAVRSLHEALFRLEQLRSDHKFVCDELTLLGGPTQSVHKPEPSSSLDNAVIKDQQIEVSVAPPHVLEKEERAASAARSYSSDSSFNDKASNNSSTSASRRSSRSPSAASSSSACSSAAPTPMKTTAGPSSKALASQAKSEKPTAREGNRTKVPSQPRQRIASARRPAPPSSHVQHKTVVPPPPTGKVVASRGGHPLPATARQPSRTASSLDSAPSFHSLSNKSSASQSRFVRAFDRAAEEQATTATANGQSGNSITAFAATPSGIVAALKQASQQQTSCDTTESVGKGGESTVSSKGEEKDVVDMQKQMDLWMRH